MQTVIPPLPVLALTDQHERIRENRLNPLKNIDRKKTALLALGGYTTRTLDSMSHLTTTACHIPTAADQNDT